MYAKTRPNRRRANAVAMVAIGLPVILGFAALSIDMGMLYNARSELQRTADAAALAAALELGDNTGGNGVARAKQAVVDLAAQNKVLGQPVGVDLATDFILGQAAVGANGQYTFTPTTVLPNAVKVLARRTAGSPSGPVPLAFANIFNKSTADVSASAIGVLTPRDIAFVLDLSGSHNDNSCLVSCKNPDVPMLIENRPVWAYLWDTTTGAQPFEDGYPLGPYFGNMNEWGDLDTGPTGINVNDPGLKYLPRYQSWSLSSDWVSQTLSSKGYGTYTTKQMSAINSSSSDSNSSYYQRRVMVALGLVRWKSSSTKDTTIDASETTQVLVPYPSSYSNPATHCAKVGGSWSDYISYVSSSGSQMCQVNPDKYYYGDTNCQYRYGLKTYVDYLQTDQAGDGTSPGLAGAPEQPMNAVADGVKTAISIIEGLQSNDQVGMAGYGQYGYGPSDKPNNLAWLSSSLSSVSNKVDTLQAGMWTSTTNTADGIDEGVKVLFDSPNARQFAAKVLILLTDGRPNQTRSDYRGRSTYIEDRKDVVDSEPYTDAEDAARDAAARGVVIYTIGVGQVANEPALNGWLTKLAAIGRGKSFAAPGDIATYRDRLQSILQDLGGKRPVVLAQ